MKINQIVKNDSVFIALGANLASPFGAPGETLAAALRRLDQGGIAVKTIARWRGTPAFPAGSGPEFVNGAARLETDLAPAALLARLHEVEAEMGRTRDRRWGPRVCDIDLLAMGDLVAPGVEDVRALMALGPTRAATQPAPAALILPHPRMHERAFVLAPLADIAGDWRHPLIGQTAAEMLAALPKGAAMEVEIL